MSIPDEPLHSQAPQPAGNPYRQGQIPANAQYITGRPIDYCFPEPQPMMSGRETVLLALAIVNLIFVGLGIAANFSAMMVGLPLGVLFFLLGLVILILGMVSVMFLITNHLGKKNLAIGFGALLVMTYLIGLLLDLGSYLAVPEHGLLADVTRAELAMSVTFDAVLLVLGIVTEVLAFIIAPAPGPGSGPDVSTEKSA